MENWIARHANKLVLAFGLLVSWSFLDISRQSKAIMPELKALRFQVEELYLWQEDFETKISKDKDEYLKHIHVYSTGKPKTAE